MNMATEMPDCPKCHCGAHHVEVLVIVIPKVGPERVDFACAACGHGFSTLTPQVVEIRGLAPATR